MCLQKIGIVPEAVNVNFFSRQKFLESEPKAGKASSDSKDGDASIESNEGSAPSESKNNDARFTFIAVFKVWL